MRFLFIIIINKFDSSINLIENIDDDINDDEKMKIFKKQETLTEDIIDIFLYALSVL